MLAVQWLLFSLALSSCNAWWSASPLQYAGIEQKGAAWNRWRPFSAKLVRCNSAHGFIPILRIPAGSIDDSSVIDFIHEWSRDQVMVGSTFTVQTTRRGAQFHFTPAPGSVLTLQVGGTNGAEVIEESLHLEHGKGRASSSSSFMDGLVRSAATSIVSSFRDDFSLFLASLSQGEWRNGAEADQNVVQILDHASGKVTELSEDDVDMDYIQANAKDLGSDVQRHIASLFTPESTLPASPPESRPQPIPPPRTGQSVSAPLPSDPVMQYAAQTMDVSVEQLSQATAKSAAKELQAFLHERSTQGFAAVLRDLQSSAEEAASEDLPTAISEPVSATTANTSRHVRKAELDYLFAVGRNLSQQHVLKLLDRSPVSPFDESPAEWRGETAALSSTQASPSTERHGDMETAVVAGLSTNEDVFLPAPPITAATGVDTSNPQLVADRKKLAFLIVELSQSAPELHDLILDGFPDLLLSDHVMALLSEAASTEQDARVRQLYKKIVDKAVAAHVQLAVKMKQETQRHLQTILEVCEAFIRHSSNEKALMEAINLLRPRMDASLLAYINHALREAQQDGERVEPLPATEATSFAEMRPSQGWVRILQIMRAGVVAELEHRHEWLLDVLTFVVRFHELPEVQAELFRRLVEQCVATNLGTLRQLARNMVEHVLTKPSSQTKQWLGRDADGKKMMERLGELVEAFLSEDAIRERLQAYEKEIEAQGLELAYRHRDAARQNELAAAEALETRSLLEGSGKGVHLPGFS